MARLLRVRNIAFDAFHLLDQDDDLKLRKINFDHEEEEFYEGDIDENFEEFLKGCLPDPESKESQEWLESFRKAFLRPPDRKEDKNIKEMDFNEF